jgi:DNA-binding beta-propeller fold protein YncE
MLALVACGPAPLTPGEQPTPDSVRLATPGGAGGLRPAPASDQAAVPVSSRTAPAIVARTPGRAAQGPPLKVERVAAFAGAPAPWSGPLRLAVDSQGGLYVLDAGQARVDLLGRDGRLLATWGGQGDGIGRFRFRATHRCDDSGDRCGPELGGALAVDHRGRVYVADYGNHRVQVFDRQGRWLVGWGRAGSGPGEFRLPAGIAVDAEGQVWVADTGNHRIQQFDAGGRLIGQWGGLGQATGRLDHPTALVADTAGQVIVADMEGSRVQQFDRQGRLLERWGLDGGAEPAARITAIAAHRSGLVYASDASGSVDMRDWHGQVLARWRADWRGDGQLRQPTGIAVDEQGNVYVADQGSRQVCVFQLLLPTTG